MITPLNIDPEQAQFRRRLHALSILIALCFMTLLARLIWLQIIEHDHFSAQADSNRIAYEPLVPTRGNIVDRHGVVLVRNVGTYALDIAPALLDSGLDQTLDRLASVVSVSARDRRRLRTQLASLHGSASATLRSGLTDEEMARFAANSFRFHGVTLRVQQRRDYPLGDFAAHALGYLGRINPHEAELLEGDGRSANYRGSSTIGKSGLELSYETQLHGVTGYQQVEVTASGRQVRTLARRPAVPGENLVLSLDAGLQQAAEHAFGNHRWALVAIDPSNGEVLAYVSRPGYDPNLFVDGIDQDDWDNLNGSIDRPLLNRPASGTYAPGSTFKPFMALAALELGLRTPEQSFDDPGYLMVGQHKFRDDGAHGMVNLRKSIVVSCNTYYFRLGTEMSIDTIHRFMEPFGFGQPSGIDLVGESVGVLPSTDWKRHQFRDPASGRWYVGDTVSVSNGSGYNAYTPLQMAKAIATLANNGVALQPHLVHALSDPRTGAESLLHTAPPRRILLAQRNLDVVKDAMVGVTSDPSGTASKVFAGAGYTVGGKTGTAQVVNIAKNAKYNAAALAERARDNGLFTAFAPADHLRIALAVIVENGGWGTEVAAPIARATIDFYLHGAQSPLPQAGHHALAALN